jgi:DNA-binding transcriptional MerR regulator
MKMKRNQVDINIEKVLTEVNRQIGEWNRSYSAIMDFEKLEIIEAAERYVSLLEIKDILELIQKQGLSLKAIKSLLINLKPDQKPKQSSFLFGSGNHSPKNPI